MPAMYDAMKKQFMKNGMSEKSAKKKAAMIYNSKRKKGQKPVTRYSDYYEASKH